MSEYQYYEFQAIDRPLTEKQMAFVRGYSTRATITATSFVNEYQWGNFKGDEDAWMDRYFDAFLYTSNWGTNILKLRIPSTRLSLATARRFCAGSVVAARQKLGKTIITFASDDETGNWEGNYYTLGSMISVRNDLARGDMRALYLGWLRAAQNEEIEENTAEPPVPAGLGQLDASLHALVSFLRIDEGLIRAAARTSPPLPPPPNRRALAAWVKALPAVEKNRVLARVVADDPFAASELRDRFVSEHDKRRASRGGMRRRTVRDLMQEI